MQIRKKGKFPNYNTGKSLIPTEEFDYTWKMREINADEPPPCGIEGKFWEPIPPNKIQTFWINIKKKLYLLTSEI